jgi:SAM-dependent methyltransferase
MGTVTACRICGNAEGHSLYTAREMRFGLREEFDYFQCAGCGCLQCREFPAELGRYYPPGYYSFDPVSRRGGLRGYLVRQVHRYAVLNSGLVGRVLYSRYPFVDLRALGRVRLTRDSAVLDVGCGAGRLLCNLRDIGFQNLLGADPYIEQDLDYEGGVRVLKKTIREIEGKWDLIMFHHSLEHVSDPLADLTAAKDRLKAGGTCLVRVPTVSSYAWRHYGVNWVQLDAPRHLFLHSVESVRILAERSGLRLREVVYDSSSFQFYGSEQYVRGIPLESTTPGADSAARLFSKAEIRRFEKRAKELNRKGEGDQAAFYLGKD